LTDTRHHPTAALIALYHERWEHEIAYLALRHTLPQGRVLRSADPAGLEQEMWALLTVYQALPRAMVTAVESRPGTDPDRASFITALQTSRPAASASAARRPGACGAGRLATEPRARGVGVGQDQPT
jgi:hypothetical protein